MTHLLHILACLMVLTGSLLAPICVAEDVEPVQPPIELHWAPQSVSLSRNASFDDNGAVSYENGSLNIGFQVRVMSEHALTGYEILSVDPMDTTRGQTLKAQVRGSRQDIRHHNNDDPQFHLNISIPNPGNPSGHIRMLRGQMRVHYAAGRKMRVHLSTYGEIVGKRAKIQGLTPGAWVRTREQKDSLRIEMPSVLMQRLDAVRFYDEEGIELSANSWNTGSNGDTKYRSYRVEVPAGGRIELDFWERMETLDVPFQFEHFPLPEDPGDTSIDFASLIQPCSCG